MLVTALATLALAACGGKGKAQDPATVGAVTAASDKTLYVRLGGTGAITAVVAEFMEITAADPRIDMFFMNMDAARVAQMMVDQICAGTGGPCEYTGRPMKELHTGMRIRPEHFEAFMDNLARTLDKVGVAEPERSELITIFRSMQADIVNL